VQLGRVQVHWVHGRAQRTIRSPQPAVTDTNGLARGGWALADQAEGAAPANFSRSENSNLPVVDAMGEMGFQAGSKYR
jgi:hypothetical protein